MNIVIQHRIDSAWPESWNSQNNNKLHCLKPVIGALPVMPMQRTDVKLTRPRIGHTRFTHRHLILGENPYPNLFAFLSAIGMLHQL
ncbi:RNase H domain-containing protein [Trichonephila clavipes]|nr:RNase H domain-containing protein [Trichonephila clavipes]